MTYHLADDIFNCISFYENLHILIQIPLKFVPKFPIDNKPALFQMMAWCWTGHKTLSEPMMASFFYAHMCLSVSMN